MTTLGECLTSLPSALDSGAIAGCYQADAAVKAAYIAAHATRSAANISLLAGSAAFVGGLCVLLQPWLASRLNEHSKRRRIAQTYLAELQALHDFLNASQVQWQLAASIAANGPLNYHPGDLWLRTYLSDPQSIGVFPAALATQVVSYCCRMHNELGRLRWMHDDFRDPYNVPHWLAREEQTTRETLLRLAQEQDEILPLLRHLSE